MKTFALIIIAILMASIMLFAIPIPTSKAQVTIGGMGTYPAWATTIPTGVTPNSTVVTSAWMSVSPNPVGVGQLLLINLWTEPPVQTNRFHSGYTVTITKPDGNTVTVGPMNSFQGDTTAYFNYVPDQAGNYTFVFNFPGNYYPQGYYYNGVAYPTLAAVGPYVPSPFGGPALMGSAYYDASTSPTSTISVQKAAVAGYPAAALPGVVPLFESGYWTYPIPIGNREWWVIGGQYPFNGQGGCNGTPWPANTNTFASNYHYTPYVQGPTSAHIVWMWQGGIVGIAGGQFGYRSVGSGETNYAGLPTIIFQGRAFQTITIPKTETINGSDVTETVSVWESYNIQTGQVYWQQTGITQPPTVVTQNLGPPSEPGAGQTGIGTGTWALMYVGSRLIKYDPWSGAVQFNISIPVTSGTVYDDPYVLSVQSLANGQYALINWTTGPTPQTSSMTAGAADTNFTDRIISNVTYPFSSLGTCDFESMVAVSTGSIIPIGADTAMGQFVMGASLTTGKLLWNVTTSDIFFSTSTGCADHGMYAVRCLGGFWDCWSLATGNLVWQTAKPGTPGGETYPWGDFGPYTTASYGGLLYDFSYAGFYALNWTNGAIAWHYVPPCAPFEGPWYPSMSLFSNSPQIAGGILYYANGEHSPTEPLARGWMLYALNATTGQLIWDMTDGGLAGPVSGGYLTFGDNDNGYLEVFGIGPSATTVSAPQTAITAGTPVIISGAVLDESPAQAGNACVSDASMTCWMSYLHDQQPIDGIYHNETVTGVPVSINAIDPNGNFVNIGTATNDMSGTYSFTWTPKIAGTYKISATFAGDDSYGSSSAETAAVVVNAPTATPTAKPTSNLATTSDLMTYIIIGVIAIIIAIAIVGALILRKHP